MLIHYQDFEQLPYSYGDRVPAGEWYYTFGDIPAPVVDDGSGLLTMQTAVSLLYAGSTPRQSQAMHGLVGWKGEDWTAGCGTPIYSPVPGRATVTYNALDGYVGPYAKNGEQNTMITIVGDAGVGEVTLLHSRYTAEVGQRVRGGESVIGYEESTGNSTGCHNHIVVRGRK